MSDVRPIPPRMTWAQVHARRLQRHWLVEPAADARPADVCGRIAGAHAQVMAAAELSLGIRMATGTRSDVRQALWVDRSLVKTFGPRGTVHLLPAHELPMWTSALSSVPAGPDGLPPELRLSDAQTAEIVAAIDAAVRDAELTLDELGERVVAATGPWADARVIPAFNEMWPRWRRAIIPAARQGVLCFGPDRGRNVTYTSPRRWLPGFAPADPDAAIADLVRRYLSGYGPATPAQFAQWLAAPKRWAIDLFERLGRGADGGRRRRHARLAADRRPGRIGTPTPGGQTPALLRRVHGRLSPARAAVPGSCRAAGTVTRPGRQRAGIARGRGRWRRVAPATVRQDPPHPGGAIRAAQHASARRARRAGRTAGADPGGRPLLTIGVVEAGRHL